MTVDSPPTVETVVAHELDDLIASFPYKVVRLGVGRGPNVHRQITFDDVKLQSGSIGFPAAGETTIEDEQIAIALSVCAPPRTRWSEQDFPSGTMLAWGPRAEATWVNQAGGLVQIALVDLDAIRATSETLQRRVRLPEPGVVLRLPGTSCVRRTAALLSSLGDPSDAAVALPDSPTDLLVAVAHVLADEVRRPPPRIRRLDSRRLVRQCVDYVDDVGGRPSIAELCLVGHVSERRLRQAFVDAFDMGPVAYFRLRTLSLARSKLLDPDTSTVTEVASQLGVHSLGRFAEQYRHVYREAPSRTVAAARRATQPRPSG